MAKLTRSRFLKQTSVGAATLGAVAAGGTHMAMAATVSAAEANGLSHAATAEPIVAHVRNIATGEIALMVGTKEVIVRDTKLVARLLRAAR